MKNYKYIKALLFGASISLTAPTVAPFAADATDQAPAAEPAEDTAQDAAAAENTGEGQPATETPAPATEGAADDNTEASGAFADRLTEVSLDKDTFGDEADKVQNIITTMMNDASAPVSSMTLDEFETKLFSNIDAAYSDNKDMAKSVKYYTALAFEKVFGDEAEKAGKELRLALLNDGADTQKTADEMFASTPTLSDIDAQLMPNAGIVKPAYVKAQSSDSTQTDAAQPETAQQTEATQAAANATALASGDEEAGEADANAASPQQTIDLVSYVSGVGDTTIAVGDAVPAFDGMTFDKTYVSGVTFDTSKIDTTKEGSYPFTMNVQGTNGETASKDFTCTVEANAQVAALREKYAGVARGIDSSMLIGTYLDEWKSTVENAVSEINKKSSEAEMKTITDALPNKLKAISDKQTLDNTKGADLDSLAKYYGALTFKDDSVKALAKAEHDKAVASIKAAKTIDESHAAFTAGQKAIQGVVDENTETIDTLKKDAVEAMKKNAAEYSSDFTKLLTPVFEDRINSAKDADALKKVNTTISNTLSSLDGIDKNFAQVRDVINNLKGLSQDADTTSVLDSIAKTTAKKSEDAVQLTEFAAKALLSDAEGFKTYFKTLSGATITGDKKVDIYASYQKYVSDSEKGREEQEKLQKAKSYAKDELDALLSSVSDTDSKAKAETIVSKAKADVDAATSADSVKSITDKAKADVKTLISQNQAKKQLEDARAQAMSYIDSYASTRAGGDTDISSALEPVISSAKRAVSAASAVSEINAATDTFKSNVDTIVKTVNDKKTAASLALASAKSSALSKLSALQQTADANYTTDDMRNIITNAISAVSKAGSVDECDKIYQDAETNFKNAYLTAIRKAYTDKVNKLMDVTFASEASKTKAQKFVDTALQSISKATDVNAMESIYNTVKGNIDSIMNADAANGTLPLDSATTIEQARTSAIAQLTNYANKPSDSTNKILEQYKNKINYATSIDDVKKYLNEGEKLIDAVGGHVDDGTNGSASGTSGTSGGGNEATANGATSTDLDRATTVEEARAAGIEELKNYITKPSDGATKILSDYTDKINSASTIDDVKALVKEAEKQLDAIGAHTGSSDATAKGDSSLTETQKVQTGDNNGPVFAGIAVAMAAAAAAIAGVFMRKRSPKNN